MLIRAAKKIIECNRIVLRKGNGRWRGSVWAEL